MFIDGVSSYVGVSDGGIGENVTFEGVAIDAVVINYSTVPLPNFLITGTSKHYQLYDNHH